MALGEESPFLIPKSSRRSSTRGAGSWTADGRRGGPDFIKSAVGFHKIRLTLEEGGR